MSIPSFVSDALAALGVSLSDETLSMMGQYLDLVLEANQRFNLTAIRDRDEAWGRHIVDSLTLLPLLDDLPDQAKVLDVGSGAGLPGSQSRSPTIGCA